MLPCACTGVLGASNHNCSIEFKRSLCGLLFYLPMVRFKGMSPLMHLLCHLHDTFRSLGPKGNSTCRTLETVPWSPADQSTLLDFKVGTFVHLFFILLPKNSTQKNGLPALNIKALQRHLLLHRAMGLHDFHLNPRSIPGLNTGAGPWPLLSC